MALGDLTSVESVSSIEQDRTSTERVGDEYRFGTTAFEVIAATADAATTQMKPDRLSVEVAEGTTGAHVIQLPAPQLCTGRIAVVDAKTSSGSGTIDISGAGLSPLTNVTDSGAASHVFISTGVKWIELDLA